jgi:uroporphyrinogen III methyltransferase/synthase
MQATMPLSGMRIVVTRSASQAIDLSKKLRSLGAITIEIPTIEIRSPPDIGPIDNSITRLRTYDWIIFTSVRGVEFFLQRMEILHVPLSALDLVKIAAIGSATSGALERAGRKPDYVPSEFLSERIAVGLGDLHGRRVLLPRANVASKTLPFILRDKGATVDEVVAYETISPQELNSDIIRVAFGSRVNVVTFTSPSTVRNFVNAIGYATVGELLSGVRIACIGPVTAEAARHLGMKVNVIARPHTIDGLIEAIVSDIRNA